MKQFCYLLLGLSVTCLLGATVYNQFSPGGALSGTWNSQNVNMAAGPSFILNQLPTTAGGTGLGTLTTHGVLLGEGTANLGSVAAMAVDTLLQGKGSSADPAAVSLVNCGDSSHALAYSTTSHTFSCQSITTLTTPVTVPNGGTGLGTLTTHGVLLGEGTANLGSVAAMAADTLLQGQGSSADPAAVSLTNCGDATHALAYSTSTHLFACQALSTGTTSLTSTQIAYGNASNVINGTSDLTYTHSTETLQLGDNASAFTINGVKLGLNINGGNASGNPGLGGNVVLNGGQNTSFSVTGGSVTAQGGQTFNGGAVSIVGGLSPSGTGGAGGPVTITGGAAQGGSTGGSVTIGSGSGGTAAGSVIVQVAGTTGLTVQNPGAEVVTSGALISGGTAATVSGCSNTNTAGGAIAGQFKVGQPGSSTCTVTITLPTAPHGWACYGMDINSQAPLNESATTTTSCTITGTTASSVDIVVWSARGY